MITLAAFVEPPSLQQWILIGLLGAALLVIVLQSRRRKEPGPGRPSALERAEAALEQAAARGTGSTGHGAAASRGDEASQQVRKDFEQLLTELEHLSERITLQVEEEFGRLQGLMTEADRRISALRVLIEASRQLREPMRGDALNVSPSLSSPVQAPSPTSYSTSRSEVSAAPSPMTSSPPPVVSAPLDGGLESDPRFAPIFQLADAGFTPRDIAQKLGESTGTVELVLNLRNPAPRSIT